MSDLSLFLTSNQLTKSCEFLRDSSSFFVTEDADLSGAGDSIVLIVGVCIGSILVFGLVLMIILILIRHRHGGESDLWNAPEHSGLAEESATFIDPSVTLPTTLVDMTDGRSGQVNRYRPCILAIQDHP
jgi:hypothetical protein